MYTFNMTLKQKSCRRCNEVKPLNEYRPGAATCNYCYNFWQRQKYTNNKEHRENCKRKVRDRVKNMTKEQLQDLKIKNKHWREKNKYRRFLNHIRLNYSLSQSDFELLFESQKKCCAICKKPLGFFQGKLHIDHCHKTGNVRGILCNKCNAGLGFFQDKISSLANAITYLLSC